MAVRRAELVGDAVAAAEDDRDLELPAGHVADVGGVVHDLVDADQVNDQLMNSMIGRSPTIAAPTPRPEKPASLIGVSITRRGPNLLEHALGDLVRAVVLGDFLAHEEDVLVALHLLGHGWRRASRNCISGMLIVVQWSVAQWLSEMHSAGPLSHWTLTTLLYFCKRILLGQDVVEPLVQRPGAGRRRRACTASSTISRDLLLDRLDLLVVDQPFSRSRFS